MATLTSQLIVSLLDRVSGPSRAVSAALAGLTAAQARNQARLAAARVGMVEAGAVAYALARAVAAPARAATEFETKLEDIGQKIEAPISALPKLGREIRAVARDTTQTAAAMAEGMDVLAGMGASREDALGLLKPIGRAATAYNAAITDLSQAGYAALDNLKVPALEFGKALDAMAQAGKAGAFELKDMAKYFPALGAAYQGLGQKGVPAVADLSAALQIVRKGAGDSSEAATNLSNILQKVNAPLTRKAFAKMGVNLEKEMKKAAKAGMTPIEAIAEITNRTLKGDLGKLGDLFQDAQVQKGLRPLIQNLDLYRKIRAEALAAQGVVEEDYQRRLQTGAMATQRWRIAAEGLNLAIGNALLPALTGLANDLIPIVNRMAEWADAHPGLTRAIVGTTAALVGLRAAGLAAQYALLWTKGGFISAGIAGLRGLQMATGAASVALVPFGRALGLVAPSARGAAKEVAAQAAATLAQRQAAYQAAVAMQGLAMRGQVVGVSMSQATAGVREAGAALVAAQGNMRTANAALAATGSSVGVVTRAFRALKVAAIGTGIGAVLIGIAMAGTWIYNNWSGISTAFEAFKGAFMRAIEPVMPVLRPVLDGIQWLSDTISSIVGPIDEMGGGWAKAGLAAGKFVGETVKAIVELPGKIIGFAGDMMNSGIALAQSLWDGLKTKIGDAVAWFSELPTRIAAALGDMLEAGRTLAQSLWDGVSAKIDEMLAWFKGLPGRIIEAIGSIDIGSLIKWPSMPSWLGGGTPSGNANPDAGRAVNTMLDGMEKRASGGPVQGGRTYVVGERGPELFSPGRSGFISPNEVYASTGAGSRPVQSAPLRPNVSMTIHNQFTVNGVTDLDSIARRLSQTVNEALSGIQVDLEYSPGL